MKSLSRKSAVILSNFGIKFGINFRILYILHCRSISTSSESVFKQLVAERLDLFHNMGLFIYFILSYPEPSLSDVIFIGADDVVVYFGTVDKSSLFVTNL